MNSAILNKCAFSKFVLRAYNEINGQYLCEIRLGICEVYPGNRLVLQDRGRAVNCSPGANEVGFTSLNDM
jgi:hypothetical protein